MIIYRYLSRELFVTTVAVSVVLVMILVIGRGIKYLAQAAAGRISGEVILLVMTYRLPSFLELILPLAMFLAILLAYGRMYLDNEMTVLEACGVSQRNLLGFTALPAICMAGLVGLLSLVVGPWGADKAHVLLQEQKNKSGLEVLSPGRFHSSRDGSVVTYAGNVGDAKGVMEQLFLVNYHPKEPTKVTLITARQGTYRIDHEKSGRYLQLDDGSRIQGTPGDAGYSRTSFARYEMKLEDPEPILEQSEYEYRSTRSLWEDGGQRAQAEFFWRVSVPLLVPIVILLSVPLSRVNPRQGRYLKLLPSVMIYLAYLALLLASKGAIEKGRLPPFWGYLWVHIVFFLLGLLILNWQSLVLWRRKRRTQAALAGAAE